MRRSVIAYLAVATACWGWPGYMPVRAAELVETPRLAFVGLHGGVFEALKLLAPEAGVEVDYVADEAIAAGNVEFGQYRMVLLQHVRDEDREQYLRLLSKAKEVNPELQVLSISEIPGGMLADFQRQGIVEFDPALSGYYGSSVDNLRLMLRYVGVKYLGKLGGAPPPLEDQGPNGLYHPDAPSTFATVAEFKSWAAKQGKSIDNLARAVVAVHSTHLAFQQPQVVNALIREFEKQGVLAVAMVDMGPEYFGLLKEFAPQVVVHTCHSSERVDQRVELGALHMHSIFFRKQSIDEWRTSAEGLAANEMAFQIVGQELLGAIEPQIGAGTLAGGGSSEDFVPIAERIEHVVARAKAWIRLATVENKQKKIAFIYYDREMGKAELMRGSATGMFMNAPRSIVNILDEMSQAGYRLKRVPQDEDELLLYMQDHGRQIGIWAPGVLDKLALSGKAVLVPAAQYQEWFTRYVPETLRRQVEQKWGPPPGRFLVWKDSVGEEFIVIPRVDLGNVILLPQPLRGEAQDTSLVHDKLVPPPHNYLATYFWLQAGFHSDALVHFGTHGSEFLLPGKPTGLSDYDWPDILMGQMPNINPWIINNLGESSPVRRRAYAVLIDHLVPPSVNAELSDELLNLHNDIDHWVVLDDGALKEKFRRSITEQVRTEHLDRDLKLDLKDDRILEPQEIEQVLEYLHNIHNETTPISLHVFGKAPPEHLLIPYLATCLGKRFIDALGEVIEVPAEEALNPGDRAKYLRRKGEEILTLLSNGKLAPTEVLEAVTGSSWEGKLPNSLDKSFRLAEQLSMSFAQTHEEIDNLLAALDGKFIPPGPGNSPDRNPAVVPTGKNMFVLNPEEVPSRPSWELGQELVDQLLAQQFEKKGHYPEKIGFTLSSFATFQDYGVMEAQIMALIGVRPVWDERNLVVDVELIPAEELGRPRIDVFIAGLSYYRDMLPTRMRLLDKAVRLVAELDEPDNLIHRNSARVRQELIEQGVDVPQAERLSRARIFGYPPGQYGSAGYYYLVEKSGEWDTREDLMDAYLSQVRHVYTEGLWGEPASAAYERQIQGTEIVLRSWSDRTRSPLSNKYDWYIGGSLCLAVKHLTGKEPEYFLTDVRDPDAATMVTAEDALRREYRVRLFNRKWIEGMMKEGYAGADQISVHVNNTMGWKIMRENSVSDDLWEEIVEIYLRDSKDLAIREWFEAENPYAFQDINEVLLETIRKGYWQPDSATVREIATAYAESVARHGEGGGLRGGGNTKLAEFVKSILSAPGDLASAQLLADYEAQVKQAATHATSEAVPARPAETPTESSASNELEEVQGKKLEESAQQVDDVAESPSEATLVFWGLVAIVGLIVSGYLVRRDRVS